MENQISRKSNQELREIATKGLIKPCHIVYDHLDNEIIGVYTDTASAQAEIDRRTILDMERIIMNDKRKSWTLRSIGHSRGWECRICESTEDVGKSSCCRNPICEVCRERNGNYCRSHCCKWGHTDRNSNCDCDSEWIDQGYIDEQCNPPSEEELEALRKKYTNTEEENAEIKQIQKQLDEYHHGKGSDMYSWGVHTIRRYLVLTYANDRTVPMKLPPPMEIPSRYKDILT